MDRGIIGIDEAGRGPLAGPLSVGAVCLFDEYALDYLSGVTDSKILTPEARMMWKKRIVRLQEEGKLSFSVTFVGPGRIDSWGMTRSLMYAVEKNLKNLNTAYDTQLFLDGSLYAPHIYTNQETIIRGDLTEPIISAASIIAKVYRDEYMERLAPMYPQYCFEIHKGYGTEMHRDAIEKYGLCPIHRRSFCKRFI